MDRAIRKEIIRLWDAMLPLEQIYQMLPCKLADAKRYVANLREDGTLKPRQKKERSMRLVAEAYNSGVTDIDELADMFNFKPKTVIEYLNKMGISRPRTKYNTTVSEKTSNIIREIREANSLDSQIAKKYGVSRQYIYYLKQRM